MQRDKGKNFGFADRFVRPEIYSKFTAKSFEK